MNATIARQINTNALSLGAICENSIIQLLNNAEAQSIPFILGMDYLAAAAHFNYSFPAIVKDMISGLEEVVKLSYNYTLNMTLLEEEGYGILIPSNAIGYTSKWMKDRLDYKDRVVRNMTGIKDEINALLIGFKGDPLVLQGLIHDIINKAKNQWLRLIRTELEAAYSQGNRDALLERGTRVAIIENDSPCDMCEDEVGEHEVDLLGTLGIDLPPYHPNCKCIFTGIFYN